MADLQDEFEAKMNMGTSPVPTPSPTSSSSTPAMDAFLSTPELLEALFLECDMRDVLTSVQRVCRQWHEIITTTPSVQVHLFFRPARRVVPSESAGHHAILPPSSSEQAERERSLSSASEGSNFSTFSASTVFSASTSLSHSSTSSTSSRTSQPQHKHRLPHSPRLPTVNPLLAALFPPFFQPLASSVTQRTYNGRRDIESLPLAQYPDAFLYVDASWRRMLVQQPPCEAMGVSMPETGYSVLYSRRHQQRRARERREQSLRGSGGGGAGKPQQQQQQGEEDRTSANAAAAAAAGVMPGAGGSTSSTRAEGKCNSFGSFVHGRLGRHASSSAGSSSPPSEVSANEEGAGAGAIAAPSTPLTPSPPTPPPEHDGLIRMWDLYDAVVRGLADPGLRWMVLWRPSTVPASQPLSDWTVPDGGRPAMENSGGASYNPTGAEQAGYQNEGRDVEADEHKRNLAAWQLPPPPPLSPLSRSSAAGLFATMATPAAETNIWDPNTIHNLVDDQQLLSGAAVSREDLLGGCTAELMKRGAELIVVRRRDINENAFLGWSQFRHFQGRYVNPHWLAVGGAGAGGGGSSAGGLGAGDANGTGVVGSGRTMMMSSSLERIGGDGRVVITGQPTRSHRREL